MKKSVLVLDGDMNAALSVVRSLHRRGLRVVSAAAHSQPLCAASRAVNLTLSYPDPLTHTEEFLCWLRGHVATNFYDLIIPVTERTLLPISARREFLRETATGVFPFVLPESASVDAVLDKSRTMALARDLGVPVPGGVLLERVDDIDAALARLAFPMVIKPVRSVAGDGGERIQLSVSYARDEEELRRSCERALRYGQVMLQEFVIGRGVGVEVIADRGEIVYAFQHNREHEVPLVGGGSSLRVSAEVDPGLLESSVALIRALNWHGVAMVEFKQDSASGDHRLMEINGRFWGSLPLAEAAGVDFPGMLYDLHCSGSIPAMPDFRRGIYCRKLRDDWYWYELVLRRDDPSGLFRFPSRGALTRDLLRYFSPRHRFDVQKWRDPRPGLIDLGDTLRGYSSRISVALQDRRKLRAQRRAWQSGQVGRQLAGSRSVLFLCYGNINRSALAEAVARSLPKRPDWQFDSAGFHRPEGRPADPVMVEIARELGADLGGWSSKRVAAQAVAKADLVFVMDLQNLEHMQREFPDAMNKTFLLGPAAGARGAPLQIDDPYGRPRESYEGCAATVHAAVTQVVALAGAAQG